MTKVDQKGKTYAGKKRRFYIIFDIDILIVTNLLLKGVVLSMLDNVRLPLLYSLKNFRIDVVLLWLEFILMKTSYDHFAG